MQANATPTRLTGCQLTLIERRECECESRRKLLRTTLRIMNINKCAAELINDTPHFQLATRRKQQAADSEQDISQGHQKIGLFDGAADHWSLCLIKI